MSRLLKSSNDYGYTLIESLFQLIIFAVFVQLFLLFFYWKAPIERHYTDTTSLSWEMFAVDLQDELVNVRKIEVHSNAKGIQFVTERGRINIEQNNTVIRKSIDGLGHIPFLTAVSSTDFKLNDTTLFVAATMLDGTRKERDFEVGIYP